MVTRLSTGTDIFPIALASFDSAQLRVVRFRGHEELSRLYGFDILLHAPRGYSDDFEVEALGQKVCLSIESRDHTRRLHGLVAATSATVHRGDIDGAHYRIRVVPRMWLLSQRRSHRIFQHQSAPEIVAQILKEWDIDYRMATVEEHPKLEYRVQYGESDLDFVSRLLEEAGIAYYFKTPYDSKKQVTEVVFCEDPKAASLGALPYHDSPPDAEAGHFVTKVHLSQVATSGKVALRDFDFQHEELSRLKSLLK